MLFRSTEEITLYKKQTYIWKHIVDNFECKDPPESVTKFEADVMMEYYRNMVAQMGMEFSTYLEYMGMKTEDEFIEASKSEIIANCQNTLKVQAIAKSENLTVTDDDIKTYFGVDDFSDYEKIYGKPYLKLAIMQDVVLRFIAENAK